MGTERTLMAFLLGVFMLAGAVGVFPAVACANPEGDAGPGHGPDRMIQRMVKDFGVSEADARKYVHPELNPRDLMHAAILSKASGKPLGDVLTMKTLANTWRDVEGALGVSREQISAIREDMMAAKLASDLAVAKSEVAGLLQQKYAPPDIAIATVLARESQKSAAEVLSLKKINNQWRDVAKDLGITEDDFRQAMEKMREMMPPPPHRGPGFPPAGGMNRLPG